MIAECCEKLFRLNRLDQCAPGTEVDPVLPGCRFGYDHGDAPGIARSLDDVPVGSYAVFAKKEGGVSTSGEEARANLIDRDAADEFDRKH
jgi:hypothetical protein